MKSVRFGIVGTGGMGSHHARYLKANEIKGAKLAAVCDIAPEVAERMSQELDVPGFTSHTELLDSGEVDAVLIATPHYFHPVVGVDAFKRGIHVLSEKPMAVTVSEARRFVAESKKHPKVKFGLMFQMRTSPVYRTVKKMIDSGKLGELTRIMWLATFWFRPQAYYNSGGWRATWDGEGGGVLLNQAPHTLDMFQWLGGMPNKCLARTYLGKAHSIQVEDDTSAIFEYPNGATAIFVTCTTDYPGTDRLEICGDKGTVIIEGGKIMFKKVKGKGVRHFSDNTETVWSSPGYDTVEVPVKRTPEGHKIITQNFVDAILKGKPLIAAGEEGVNATELANAMILSGVRNKEVSIPVNAKEYDTFLQEMIARNKGKKKVAKKVKTSGPKFHTA